MAFDITSPSGAVRITVPERFGSMWLIYVRGQPMAKGRRWRNADPMLDAMAAIAAKCDETPGLGEAGQELRHLTDAFLAEEEG
jgi:hypothetical protein